MDVEHDAAPSSRLGVSNVRMKVTKQKRGSVARAPSDLDDQAVEEHQQLVAKEHAQRFMAAGCDLAELGKTELALSKFEQAVFCDPSNAKLYELRAQVCRFPVDYLHAVEKVMDDMLQRCRLFYNLRAYTLICCDTSISDTCIL